MTKWEYEYTSDWKTVLKLGREGWELIAAHCPGDYDESDYYILKRPLTDDNGN